MDKTTPSLHAPTRVLLVSPKPPPTGGIATWTQVLVAEAASDDSVRITHVDVGASWRKWAPASSIVRALGGIAQALWDGCRVTYRLATGRFDVLHLATSAGPAVFKDAVFLAIARCFGTAGVVHYHTGRIASDRHRAPRLFRATLWSAGQARAAFVLDRRTEDALVEAGAKTAVQRVDNMIDISDLDAASERYAEPPRDRSTVRFCFVGRVVPEKGVTELVEACASVPGSELHLVGPIGPRYRAALEELARERSRGECLVLHGERSPQETYRHLLESDFFVLPSHSEAFPYALLEAMALSVPAIVSDVGAMASMIGAGEAQPAGIAVAAKDPKTLRHAITRAVHQPLDGKTWGENGWQRVHARYRADRVTADLIRRWREIASDTDLEESGAASAE